MTIPQLSKLLPVDVRTVWPMEASSFTPWLLANAAVLGDALGLDLELQAAEHKVGGFSLDLVGRDIEADETVIVENQFGATDHRHLGQLLTYAGGTDPTTVVWIAETFRDEHRAALDWLNQRTDSATRFFGVELSVVTLHGAPPGLVAPLFDVVAKPNDWGKRVKRAAVEVSSDRDRLYLEFWTLWLERVAPKAWTHRKAPPRHFLYLPSGSTSARYGISFRSDGLMSELFFHNDDPAVNESRWSVLAKKRPHIEAVFGGPLLFDSLPHRKGCRIGVKRTAGESVDDRDAWSNYLAWFEDTQARLRAAIHAVGGIPAAPEGAATDDIEVAAELDAELADDATIGNI
jgi:hypothetical protein